VVKSSDAIEEFIKNQSEKMLKPKLKDKIWKKEFEKIIYEEWKKKKKYKFDKNIEKNVYSIDTPPPYVDAPPHVGQATTYILMDMFARFKRMTGYNVLFPLGLDRNGLPIEVAAEKRFKIKFGEVSRERFLEMCKQVLEEFSSVSIDIFQKCGISFNSWKLGNEIGDMYFTDSEEYRTLTQETFIDFWNKGVIYEAKIINNYCPGCKTTLADAEIEYKEVPTYFNEVIFEIKETGEKIVIGTTRPELICACGMIIFNPKDKRYKHLDDKTAITPLFKKEVLIKAHEMAQIEKGTGLAMMCSAGDISDIRFFREMGLEPTIAINADGTMNENAGFLKGLKIEDARNKIIERLKDEKLLVRQTQVTHRIPVCERSGDPIEFIELSELYLKQIQYKNKIRELSDKINFYAPESRQILLDWIDAISIDWPISRRRYYGTEIPLWYCKKCNQPIAPKKGKYYQPWKEKSPITKCPKCSFNQFKGEERIFDTWFDSSTSPLFILKYSSNPKFFKKNFPCSLRPQGKEIVRSWLYYTLLKCYLLTGKYAFKDIWINYHVVDEKGYKMSKSKGNVIDTKDILDKFGAEPFRLWAVTEGNLEKTDFRCSFERIKGTDKTLVKLWNISRFVSMFSPINKNKKLNYLDKWILSKINKVIKFCRENYDVYNFYNAMTKIKHFMWHDFADNYLECVKYRLYSSNDEKNRNGAIYTLNYCLDVTLKILAPVIPFITYKVYKELRDTDIHFSKFPEFDERLIDKDAEEIGDITVAIISALRQYKNKNALPLNAPLKKLIIECDKKTMKNLKKTLDDIKGTMNIKEIEFGKGEILVEGYKIKLSVI